MFPNFKVQLSKNKLIFIGIFGLAILFAGSFLGFKLVPDIVTNKIWNMKILRENTEQWEMFLKFPFPLTFKVYIFDVQNPDEILQGATPVVKEVGPYVYKAYKWRSDIEWNSTDTISYFSYMRFEFDPKASGNYSDEDFVTVLNTAYNSMLLTVEAAQPNALSMFDLVAPAVFGENNGLFTEVKVKDYLFDGLKMCENLGKGGGFAVGVVCKQIVAKLNSSKSMWLVNDTIYFASLHHKNNTHLGRFTVTSGIKNRVETAKLKLYNGLPYISTWVGEKSSCNKVRGVTTVFPPRIQKDMVFESFSEDACRSMALKYDQEETVKDILGYKFVAADDSFNASKEENFCFCVNKSRTFDGGFGCLKDGLVDLTTCTGAPILMSFPHLLYADREYTASVKGLKPNRKQHETFVTLEPISGIPLEMALRIQLNMFIRPIEGVNSMENVSRALVPVVWIEESLALGDEYVDTLKNKLLRGLKIFNIIKWTVIGIGFAALIICFFLFVYMKAP